MKRIKQRKERNEVTMLRKRYCYKSEPKERGMNEECCFLGGNGVMHMCLVLKEFYNFPSEDALCDKCRFFKTREDYLKGLRTAPYELEPLSAQHGA